MIVTVPQLVQYLEKNKGKEIGNEGITFELCPPKIKLDDIPHTVIFKKIRPPYWSKKNVSRIGPKNIERYLIIFNKNNNATASEYTNLGPKKSIAKNARYLVKLLKQMVKELPGFSKT